MIRKNLTEGDCAWIVLASGIAAYDIWALATHKETLSQSYARALGSPARRLPTIALWVYLTAHLMQIIPPEIDPLRRPFIESHGAPI